MALKERRTQRLRRSPRRDRNREIGMIIRRSGNEFCNVFRSLGGLRTMNLLVLPSFCFTIEKPHYFCVLSEHIL